MPVKATEKRSKRLPLDDWDLYRAEVICACGRSFEYVVQHPPIPMIVRGFYDDGQPIGDDCPSCWEALPVPKDAV